MKKLSVLALVLIAVIIGGCETIVAPPEVVDYTPSHQLGKIAIKATTSNTNHDLNANGQIDVPYGTVLILEAVPVDTSLHIVNWQWQFPDGSASGKYAMYTTKAAPGSVIPIKLIGIDSKNVSYESTASINISWNITGNNLVVLMSAKMESNGSGTIVFAISKERIKRLAPPPYFIKGTVNSWTKFNIPDADSAYTFIGGVLVSDPNGLYVKVTVNHMPGNQQFGFGKIDSHGAELWENFQGSPYVDSTNYTLLKYNLSSNAIVTPGGTTQPNNAVSPGLLGDQGEKWVFNLTPDDPKITLFVNNFLPFSAIKPFMSFMDSSGRYVNNISETAVTGFPNAGLIQVNYSALPMNKMVALKFGKDISYPTSYSDTTMSKSSFYNQEYRDIRFVLVPVLGKSSDGKNVKKISIRPAIKGIDY